MIKWISILLLCFSWVVSGQEEQTVYLIFEEDAVENCDIYKNENDILTLEIPNKRRRKVGLTRFVICRNIFVFAFQEDPFETIDVAKIDKTKIISINEMMEKWQRQGFENDLNFYYSNIYILEPTENHQYMKYKVRWEQRL